MKAARKVSPHSAWIGGILRSSVAGRAGRARELNAMSDRIEDYALIGNLETAALVGRDGSIDWLGMPRFDSPAFFAALLGSDANGRWRIAPVADARSTRCYRGDTMVLETTFETAGGSACVIDFMSRREGICDLVRIVRGVRGSVQMRTDLLVRYEYGSVVPWVAQQPDGRRTLTAGPDRLVLASEAPLKGQDMRTMGQFTVDVGQEICFALSWSLSYRPCPPPLDVRASLRDVESLWNKWAAPLPRDGRWAEAVRRSLLTLKALVHWETGGIVAAATTSLPEKIGGERNWDYRYCWLRDATLTLYTLLGAGFVDEARAWRDWLVRAAAGDPADLQIMYGVAGERRLPEYEVPSLAGFANSKPVRVGNAAAGQIQLDVYGEVLDALYVGRRAGLGADAASWALECALVDHLERIWREPDEGIWEVRGQRKQFTHSKVMAWVAFDRAVRSATEFGMQAPVERWMQVRDAIHREVCEHGFDPSLGSFVQAYGEKGLDASLLLIPIVGFLPASDERVRGTVAAVERQLLRNGLVLRYDSGTTDDGLPAGEGAFLACSFWLADNYILQGRLADAEALFDRLLSYRNDVGLLAEEYDPVAARQLGNFPQAFSHLALVNTAISLVSREGPMQQRASGSSASRGPLPSTAAQPAPGARADGDGAAADATMQPS
jgi:GH15 family glucan-1,4-alpha-glucosidase